MGRRRLAEVVSSVPKARDPIQGSVCCNRVLGCCASCMPGRLAVVATQYACELGCAESGETLLWRYGSNFGILLYNLRDRDSETGNGC